MQNNRFPHARRIFLGTISALALGLWAGCQSPAITNLTPSALPENPSQIYTIIARIAPKDNGYVKDSVRPEIVIDAKPYDLKKSALGENIYEFDYQLSPGHTELAYYFLIHYQVTDGNGTLSSREEFTEVQHAQVVGRYVLSLEVNRGPVGARVSILGRGFTANDLVYFDNTPVRTAFESPNAISFYVPAVEENRNYKVSMGSSVGQSPVGTFRVDAVGSAMQTAAASIAQPAPTLSSAPQAAPTSTLGSGPLSVNPSSLSLRQGEKVSLTFNTPVTANAKGILIDVTTDAPESVIMPEVIVPPGQNSVTITVEGGRPGTGNLFVKGPGAARELTVPLSVK